MHQRHRQRTFRLLPILLLAAHLSSCSILTVRDVYTVVAPEEVGKVTSTSSGHSWQDRGMEARVSAVIDDYRWHSFGPPFVPLIPTKFKLGNSTEFDVRLTLRLTEVRDFSISLEPDLISNGIEEISPYEIELRTLVFLEPGEGRNLNRLETTLTIDCLERAGPSSVIGGSEGDTSVRRLTKADIFRQGDFPEVIDWDYLSVDVVFRYRSKGDIPEHLTLNFNSLLHVDGLPTLTLIGRFGRERKVNYDWLFDQFKT